MRGSTQIHNAYVSHYDQAASEAREQGEAGGHSGLGSGRPRVGQVRAREQHRAGHTREEEQAGRPVGRGHRHLGRHAHERVALLGHVLGSHVAQGRQHHTELARRPQLPHELHTPIRPREAHPLQLQRRDHQAAAQQEVAGDVHGHGERRAHHRGLRLHDMLDGLALQGQSAARQAHGQVPRPHHAQHRLSGQRRAHQGQARHRGRQLVQRRRDLLAHGRPRGQRGQRLQSALSRPLASPQAQERAGRRQPQRLSHHAHRLAVRPRAHVRRQEQGGGARVEDQALLAAVSLPDEQEEEPPGALLRAQRRRADTRGRHRQLLSVRAHRSDHTQAGEDQAVREVRRHLRGRHVRARRRRPLLHRLQALLGLLRAVGGQEAPLRPQQREDAHLALQVHRPSGLGEHGRGGRHQRLVLCRLRVAGALGHQAVQGREALAAARPNRRGDAPGRGEARQGREQPVSARHLQRARRQAGRRVGRAARLREHSQDQPQVVRNVVEERHHTVALLLQRRQQALHLARANDRGRRDHQPAVHVHRRGAQGALDLQAGREVLAKLQDTTSPIQRLTSHTHTT